MELLGHCGPGSPCTRLAPEIQYCQSKNVKVLLSIKRGIRDYSLWSAQDAQNVANYLYRNFLSGQYGLLGSVTLDGIDFDIEGSITNLYYDDLARAIKVYSTEDRKIYVEASPQCPIPDFYLDAAIRTGLFNYIYVQFYNNPVCEYLAGNPANLFRSWDSWTSYIQSTNSVFLGLPAAPLASTVGGYIPPNDLINAVPNYGGVALWSRYWDIQTDPSYSDKIKPYVPKSK